MARLRYCRRCSNEGHEDPWHPLSDWPHDERVPGGFYIGQGNKAPAIHDDWSYRRAYGSGARAGLLGNPHASLEAAGLDTRQGHRDYLRRHGLAEGAPDTPGRGPDAKAIASKHFARAREAAWRKG